MAVTVQQPVRLTLKLRRGDTYLRTFKCEKDGAVVDITGYTSRLQIRDAVDGSVLYTGSTTNGHLTVTGNAGTVDVAIPAASTAAWIFATGVYDLEITSAAGVVTTLVEGTVTVTKDVTKD